MTTGFTHVSYSDQITASLSDCPYAALLFISCAGRVTRSRLSAYVSKYIVHARAFGRHISEDVIQGLLRGGHIFESDAGHFLALPPHAIQREAEEWVILGDARIDRLLINQAPVFEIRGGFASGELLLERVILASSSDATRLFNTLQLRAFSREELLDLVPDVAALAVPIAWEGFEPSPYPLWEYLTEKGRWVPAQSQSAIPNGVCRGFACTYEDGTTTARYFYRHANGWSPLTDEESRLWVFRTASEAGDPRTATFTRTGKVLKMPQDLPHTAYMVMRNIGCKRIFPSSELVFGQVELHAATTICEKMGIRLVKEAL